MVIDKEEMIKHVWKDAFVKEGSLTRTISILRKALEQDGNGPEYITTISKRGYRFVADVTAISGPAMPQRKLLLVVLPFELRAVGISPRSFAGNKRTEEPSLVRTWNSAKGCLLLHFSR